MNNYDQNGRYNDRPLSDKQVRYGAAEPYGVDTEMFVAGMLYSALKMGKMAPPNVRSALYKDISELLGNYMGVKGGDGASAKPYNGKPAMPGKAGPGSYRGGATIPGQAGYSGMHKDCPNCGFDLRGQNSIDDVVGGLGKGGKGKGNY